jgi:hypothetical protein
MAELLTSLWPKPVGEDTIPIYCDECGELTCEHRGEPDG